MVKDSSILSDSKKGNEVIIYRGKRYNSYSELAKSYNIKPDTFRRRLRKGMSIEEAIVYGNRYKVIVFGKEYNNDKEVAEEYNIPLKTLRNRVYSGMSIEDAVSFKYQNGKKVVAYGIEYDSLGDCARAHHINEGTFRSRVQSGLSPEEAIEFKKGTKTFKDRITILGVEYYNLRDACDKNKISYSKVMQMKNSADLSLDDIFSELKKLGDYNKKSYRVRVIVNGVIYKSISDCCKKLNISVGALYSYAREKECNVVDIIEEYYNNVVCADNSVIVEGVKYKDIKEACKAYNILYDTYLSRVNKIGMSMEEALKKPCRDRFFISIEGKDYYSVQDLCDNYGVTRQNYYHRLRSGWSIEEALGIISKNKILIDGVYYDSIKDACVKRGIPYGTILSRKKSGMSVEEAFLADIRLPNSKDVKILGVQYRSIAEACRSLGLEYKTVKSRVSSKWSIEEAFGISVRIFDNSTDVYISKDLKMVKKVWGNTFMCINGDSKTLYYTLEELQEIRKQAFLNGERF